MKNIIDLLKLIKFSHTIFAFPFAITSFLVKNIPIPSVEKIIFLILAMVFARSSAMGFNRYVDYKYDKENPRTMNRELVTGKVSHREVLIFIVLNSVGFIGVCYFINIYCFVLSPVVLGLLFFYSFWKRFSAMSHLYLGAVIGLAPIGVDMALVETITTGSVLLFLAITFWIGGFDIIYSLLDKDFDKRSGLKSLPSMLNERTALLISRIAYGMMVICLCIFGYIYQFGLIYYSGILIISILLILQHIWVKPGDLSRVNQAFFQLNSLISIIYLLFIIIEILLLNNYIL